MPEYNYITNHFFTVSDFFSGEECAAHIELAGSFATDHDGRRSRTRPGVLVAQSLVPGTTFSITITSTSTAALSTRKDLVILVGECGLRARWRRQSGRTWRSSLVLVLSAAVLVIGVSRRCYRLSLKR